MAVVNELINSKNYDEANVYIGNMSEAITGKDIYNTNNIYISSILNSFDQSLLIIRLSLICLIILLVI